MGRMFLDLSQFGGRSQRGVARILRGGERIAKLRCVKFQLWCGVCHVDLELQALPHCSDACIIVLLRICHKHVRRDQ